MSITDINRWHEAARPEPTERDFNVQLGCHLEEVAEMLAELQLTFVDGVALPGTQTWAHVALTELANKLKQGTCSATILDRENFLKELCDQVVTATGVAYCAGMNMPKALARVDDSNWSKFVNGSPVFDENGKIAKPDTYRKPDMEGCY